MPNTDNLDVVGEAIKAVIEAEKAALGLTDVWYGDQQLVPRMPAVAVDPRRVRTRPSDTGHMARNDFEVDLYVYHSKLQGPTTNLKECLQLANSIKDLLHDDVMLGGLIVYGHVEEIATGYSTKSNVIIKSTRIQWVGLSKTRLT